MDFGELNRDMANMDMIIATAVLQLINGNHHFLGDHKVDFRMPPLYRYYGININVELVFVVHLRLMIFLLANSLSLQWPIH